MEKRADALRDTLEEEILTGIIRPGERLEEVALAGRFGVSRTPIREALLQLSAAGLIRNRPRRGAFVAEVGPRRLMEMFEVMAALEAMCAGISARRATADDIARIRTAHEACGAAEDGDVYYYRNETFHEMVRVASRQEFLIEQIDALQKRLKPYRRLQLRARDRMRSSFEEHVAIFDAIAAGDSEAAANAMRRHVAVQGERFTDLLASIEQPEALRSKA